jgi:AcrR family transcriptional regulator
MARSRALQKEATRERLFSQAMRLFEERGYEAVSIDDIVRHARVARGTFYFHFPRKDDVLLEAVRRGERHIVDKMAAVTRPRPLRDVLRATTDGFAEVWGDRRELLPHAGSVALRRIAGVAHEREEEPLRRELVKHVEAAIAAGELAPGLPSQILADIFLLDVFGALMGWAVVGVPPLEDVMAAVIELFLSGAEGFDPAKLRRG